MEVLADKKLNLITPVVTTGYGVVGYNVALNMHAQGCKINLFPTGGLRKDSNLPLFKQLTQNGNMFDHDAPCLKIWHQFDLANHTGRGRYTAWPIFELDTFDKREAHHLKYPDLLIVCSQWAKDVVQSHGIIQEINVVPLGVDTSIFNSAINPQRNNPNSTVFFHAGKWEVRKGHDFMVEWFNKAFDVKDDVELWLMPHNPFLKPEEAKNWEDMYMSSEMGKAGKIAIIPWQANQNSVATIMSQTDCGLFPARAEGWNLELLEMLAMGKAVITTDYSAHTEFCNEDNSLLIQCNDLEKAYDGKWFFEQGNWASIGMAQTEQGINYMRTIHKAKQDGQDIGNLAGVETAKQYSWSNTARLLQNAIY